MVIQIQPPNSNISIFPGLNHKAGPKVLPYTKAQLMEAFKRYDLNKDGRLSKDELKKAFSYLGSTFGSFRATRAMARVDADNSGFIEITDYEMDNLVDYAFDCGFKVRTH